MYLRNEHLASAPCFHALHVIGLSAAMVQTRLSSADVEVLARELLPDLRPKPFSNLMRSVHKSIMPHLQDSSQPNVDGELT